MIEKQFDAIVVGGGIIGAAIFSRLARSGHSVLLVEKSRVGQGSTGWSGGILRCYHPSETLSQMASEALPDFHEIHGQGGPQFRRCGFLYFIYPGQESMAQERIAQLRQRIAIEWLDPDSGARHFPGMHWNDLAGAVFEPDAGYMDPVAISRFWIEGARAHGQSALEGVEFRGVACDTQGLCGAYTSLGLLKTRRVILCTGAWSPGLATANAFSLAGGVAAKAIQINTFAPAISVEGHPAYIDGTLGLYGRGENAKLVHCGLPVPDWHIDPDQPAAHDLSHQLYTRELARKRFGWAENASQAGGWRRFDAYCDNGQGVTAADGKISGLYWATGYSGGGFKIAPCVARQMENLAFGGR